jgi:hypothetical protein
VSDPHPCQYTRIGTRALTPKRTTTRGLGSGKTCIAQGYIRSALHNTQLLVPSPTYMLDNEYALDHSSTWYVKRNTQRLKQVT